MRIVTRPDFDGVVCAVLLYEAEDITEPVRWVEPNEMQKGMVEVLPGDIVANLPYHKNCALWFDHHYTNQIDAPFDGAFEIAPSAAGIIFKYYDRNFQRDYSELIRETDKIDSAELTPDQVSHPENYPYLLLSMTLSNRDAADEPYWNRLIRLLETYDIHSILEKSDIKARCEKVVEQNKAYKTFLKKHTVLKEHVSITDFRAFEKAPAGNRFLVYSLFPTCVASVKIRYDHKDTEKVIIGVGHSIFNNHCNVNVGLMLSEFGGGGHRGAGSCTVSASSADNVFGHIMDVLLKNESNEP